MSGRYLNTVELLNMSEGSEYVTDREGSEYVWICSEDMCEHGGMVEK